MRASYAVFAVSALLTASAAFAQTSDPRARLVVRYKVTELETPGQNSRGTSINDRRWIAGNMVRPDGAYRHATLWPNLRPLDLGALGGEEANSSVAWDGLNNGGLVVGFSQTSAPEPNGETWSCGFFFSGAMPTGRTCLGVAWDRARGRTTPLPPFPGGNNSYATSVNWAGRIVGWAENGVRDSTCTAPQVLQFRAAVWTIGRKGVAMRELAPLPSDSSSAATAINDLGDVVGISGACDQAVGRYSARSMVLWPRSGPPQRLPDFGGTSWNTPTAINERRQVAGFANRPGEVDLAGDLFEEAFFWDARTGLDRLGTLAGDETSEAYGINNLSMVVGYSQGPNGLRAFLWRRGEGMVDLNSLVLPGYTGVLIDARDITDFGVITGAALNADGKRVAYKAVPVVKIREK